MTQRNPVQPMFYSPVITAPAVWRKADAVCLCHTGFGAALAMCKPERAGHGLLGRIEPEK